MKTLLIPLPVPVQVPVLAVETISTVNIWGTTGLVDTTVCTDDPTSPSFLRHRIIRKEYELQSSKQADNQIFDRSGNKLVSFNSKCA